MKRITILLLAALILTGCAFSGNKAKEPAAFYYLRTHSDNSVYDDFYAKGIISSEEREASGHRENLPYLLTIYLRGPLDPELVSPFPMGCRVLNVQQENGCLTLLLNPILAEKTDIEITVACACLAKTCMELTGVDTVQIESRNLEEKLLFSRTFTEDNLFLSDDYSLPVENTEITP